MNRRQRVLLHKVQRNIKPYILPAISGTILGILLAFYLLHTPAQPKIISPCPDTGCEVVTPTATPTASPTPTPEPVLYKGKVSYYSSAGCLGCGDKQIMGNGQPFDEMAMTIAVPCEDITSRKHRYNTPVLVKNLDNGKAVQAKITDCGGFSKYNRIADVSLGIYQLLSIKTDRTNIQIEKL